MSGDAFDTDWSNPDLDNRTERSLITDISETLSSLSGESRAARKQQKLREALVREHIENRKKTPSRLRALVNRFFDSD